MAPENNTTPTTPQADKLRAARESFHGRFLTDAQFKDAIAITGVIEREIRKTGSFKDKLGDYTYAFARSEKFDAVKADAIVRDLFKERTGQSMNAMREKLIEQEQKLDQPQKRRAYDYACAVGDMIEHGDKMSFYRAATHQADVLGKELGITETAARNLMSAEFNAVEKVDFTTWGKELEERFYRPQIEAAKQKREAPAEQAAPQRTASTSWRRTGPSGP